jgi:hypothetical protein
MGIFSTILDFIINPTWHLVLLYVVLFLWIAYSMYKSWGF